MDKSARRLWIALIIIVLLLGLNALSAIQGWSPIASIAQKHIKSQTTPESLRQRVSPKQKEQQPKQQPLIPTDDQPLTPAPKQPAYNSNSGTNTTVKPSVSLAIQTAPSNWPQHAPYAPPPPVAPQQLLKQPTRPTPPQPVAYQVIYPDGSTRQIAYPYYYPQPVTVPAQ